MSPTERRFPDAETLADALSAELETCLLQGIQDRGRATLVLSGGSTPLPLFRRLRDRPLPWSAITVTLADERWVDREHPDSNAAFLHRELLVGHAAAATFVDLKNSAPTPKPAKRSAKPIWLGWIGPSTRWCWAWAVTAIPPLSFPKPPKINRPSGSA